MTTTRYAVGSRPAGRFTALVYADPGLGKTHLLSTPPVDALVVSIDRTGAETLEKFPALLAGRGVQMWVEEAFSDGAAVDVLKDARKEIETALKHGGPLPYRLVVLDGLCALEDHIYADLVAHGGSLVQTTRPEMLSRAGWGALGSRHLRVRAAALAIPRVHVVFTALERTRDDEDTKIVVVEASLGGQQGRRYQADVSYVFRLCQVKTGSGTKAYLNFERRPNQRVKARRDDLLGGDGKRVEADLGVVMRRLGYIDAAGNVVEDVSPDDGSVGEVILAVEARVAAEAALE